MEIPRGVVLKAKILKAKYEAKLEFPGGGGGGGAKQKKPPIRGGSMDIFWNCTIAPYSMSSSSRHLTLPGHLCEPVLFLTYKHSTLCLDFIAPFNLFLSYLQTILIRNLQVIAELYIARCN